MKKRSLKIMSVVLAGGMTTGMILGGCSAGVWSVDSDLHESETAGGSSGRIICKL